MKTTVACCMALGVPGHNHISFVQHIRTDDESLATEMPDFVRYLAGK